jgi:hypothetical protein
MAGNWASREAEANEWSILFAPSKMRYKSLDEFRFGFRTVQIKTFHMLSIDLLIFIKSIPMITLSRPVNTGIGAERGP